MRGHAIGRGLVVAGRFDLDEFADGLKESFPAGLEIVKTIQAGR
jgi:hypothetical protein